MVNNKTMMPVGSDKWFIMLIFKEVLCLASSEGYPYYDYS